MKKCVALAVLAGACTSVLANPVNIREEAYPAKIAGHVYVNLATGERVMTPFNSRIGDLVWSNSDSGSNGNFYHGTDGRTRSDGRNAFNSMVVDWGDGPCNDLVVDGVSLAYAVPTTMVSADPVSDPTIFGLNMFLNIYDAESGFNDPDDAAIFILGVTDLFGATADGNGWIFTFDLAGFEYTMGNTDEDADGLPDHGWGYTFRQQQESDPRNLPGSVVTKGIVGPFLVLPGNAGGLGTPPSAGVEDAIDWYNTFDGSFVFNGSGYDFGASDTYTRSNYINSYFFGGAPYASYWLELYSSAPCGGGCPADFNGDGFVDFFDFDDFVVCFEGGPCPPGKSADFNGDGFADFFDYDDFVLAFENGCP